MTETTVGADLLEALEIVAELGGDTVGEDLAVLAVDNVALSVEEPRGDLVLGGVLDDGDDTLELFRGELTGALIQVDCWGEVSISGDSLDFLLLTSNRLPLLGIVGGNVPSAFLHTMLE